MEPAHATEPGISQCFCWMRAQISARDQLLGAAAEVRWSSATEPYQHSSLHSHSIGSFIWIKLFWEFESPKKSNSVTFKTSQKKLAPTGRQLMQPMQQCWREEPSSSPCAPKSRIKRQCCMYSILFFNTRTQNCLSCGDSKSLDANSTLKPGSV